MTKRIGKPQGGNNCLWGSERVCSATWNLLSAPTWWGKTETDRKLWVHSQHGGKNKLLFRREVLTRWISGVIYRDISCYHGQRVLRSYRVCSAYWEREESSGDQYIRRFWRWSERSRKALHDPIWFWEFNSIKSQPSNGYMLVYEWEREFDTSQHGSMCNQGRLESVGPRNN